MIQIETMENVVLKNKLKNYKAFSIFCIPQFSDKNDIKCINVAVKKYKLFKDEGEFEIVEKDKNNSCILYEVKSSTSVVFMCVYDLKFNNDTKMSKKVVYERIIRRLLDFINVLIQDEIIELFHNCLEVFVDIQLMKKHVNHLYITRKSYRNTLSTLNNAINNISDSNINNLYFII